MSKFIKFEDLLYRVAIAVVAALLLCLPGTAEPLNNSQRFFVSVLDSKPARRIG